LIVSNAVLLVVPVEPSTDVVLPVVLLTPPAAMPVTFTTKVQVEPVPGWGCMLAPDRLIRLVPSTAVIVPEQPLGEFNRPFGVEMMMPAGSVSLNPTPVKPDKAFGFVTVKVKEVAAFMPIFAAPKALLTVGGATTIATGAVLLTAPFVVSVASRYPITRPEIPVTVICVKLAAVTVPVPLLKAIVLLPGVVGSKPKPLMTRDVAFRGIFTVLDVMLGLTIKLWVKSLLVR
jgi:hypothetical protein